jgi:formiminotetrahydrofolate cyclodeaminase
VPESGVADSYRTIATGTFVDRLASAEPVPGGGSASAIAASFGAALVAMVAALSAGRPRYAAHAATHERASEVGRRLADRFLELADRDAEAYAAVAAAMKLPRETDAERSARATALRAAAQTAAGVPLETVEACLELVAAAESLAGRSNQNASSDLNVATLLGEAAARGAAENVLVNLPMIGDDSVAGELTARVMTLLDGVGELAATTHAIVRSGKSRDPLPA